MMEFSSGIILHRKNNESGEVEFFMCTPDGPSWKDRTLWCFPKGHMENKETPFETALREFKEETSISLDNDVAKYEYYGEVIQNKKKTVHVFVKQYENENLNNCFSNYTTTNKDGVVYVHKEIKDYKWISLEEYKKNGIKAYIKTLELIKNGYSNQ